VFDEEV
jgi:hypothetical protein